MPKQFLKVSVSYDDIEQGIRGSCGSCPIANAVNRAVKSRKDIEYPLKALVSSKYVDIGGCRRAHTPQIARQFIYDFDHNQPVKPFDFTLCFQ